MDEGWSCCLSDTRLVDENGSRNVRRIFFENEFNDGWEDFLVEFISLDESRLIEFILPITDDWSSDGVIIDDGIKVVKEEYFFDRFKYFSRTSNRFSASFVYTWIVSSDNSSSIGHGKLKPGSIKKWIGKRSRVSRSIKGIW